MYPTDWCSRLGSRGQGTRGKKIEYYSDFVKGPGKIVVFRVFLKIGGSSSFLQEVPPACDWWRTFLVLFLKFSICVYKTLFHSISNNKTVNFAIFVFLFLRSEEAEAKDLTVVFVFIFIVSYFTNCIWESLFNFCHQIFEKF